MGGLYMTGVSCLYVLKGVEDREELDKNLLVKGGGGGKK